MLYRAWNLLWGGVILSIAIMALFEGPHYRWQGVIGLLIAVWPLYSALGPRREPRPRLMSVRQYQRRQRRKQRRALRRWL